VLTLALDIGGTKIAVGLVDPAGVLVHTTTCPTPNHEDAEHVWGVLGQMIADTVESAGGAIRAVGIGCAGPIDSTAGTVSPVNIATWRGFPLRDRVVAAVPDVPVLLAGDAICMAVGEHWRGAGRGVNFLLGMVVSTGVGGGLVLNGVPYQGRTGNAGHVGHVVVEPDGQPCHCGGRGCVETVAAGPWMTRWALANGWVGPPGADAAALAAAAAAGDAVAVQAFHRGATALAAMIASVGAVCDLNRVVIGGGVAKSGRTLFDPLNAALATYTGLSFIRDLHVVPAALGDDAGLIGAAALASSVT
jgi:glucokinase